jgi:hypothetical protein
MVFGVLWSFQTCFNIRSVRCSDFIDLLHSMKWAILVSQSIKVRMLSQLLDKGRSVIKSQLISIHGPAGIGRGSKWILVWWIYSETWVASIYVVIEKKTLHGWSCEATEN